MGESPSSRLFYSGTYDEVRLGDRVEVKRWFGRRELCHVSYIPGISPPHRELEYDDVRQWAITSDNGSVYPIVYDPESFQPPKKIKLLHRASGSAIRPDDQLE